MRKFYDNMKFCSLLHDFAMSCQAFVVFVDCFVFVCDIVRIVCHCDQVLFQKPLDMM